MSFLRKLGGGGASPPQAAPTVTSEEWEPGQFARASGERLEVRFHDPAEAKLATDQLRELMGQWQNEMRELAAAHAEEMAKHAGIVNEMRELAAAHAEEMAKHAGIVNEMRARQAKIALVIRRIDAAIPQVEAYARRNR